MEKKLTKKQEKALEIEECRKSLLSILKPGMTVYTILRHCSASGMSRDISLIVKDKDGSVRNISFEASRVGGFKLSERYGHWVLKMGGCGMDMGFSAVYSLSRCLFPEGFKPADAGRSYGRNGTDANLIDTDGGYALNQSWL